MNRLFMNCIGLAIVLALLAAPVIVRAEEVTSDSITVLVDGKTVIFTDIQPRIVDGRTLVPIREVFEMMDFSVTWSRGTSSARIRNDDTLVTARIGEDFITVNGVQRSGDVPPQIYDGRFMIPLRLVAEATGKNVYWNGDTRTAYIISPPVVYERKLDFTYEMWNIFHWNVGTRIAAFTYMDDLADFISQYSEEMNRIRHHIYSNMTQALNCMAQVDSFIMALEQYTECFFDDHVLVLILFAHSTPAWPGGIESISESGTITITRMMYQPPLPTPAVDDSWASIIEMRNDSVPESFRVSYNDIWTADSHRDLDFIAHSTSGAPDMRREPVNIIMSDVITSFGDVHAFFKTVGISEVIDFREYPTQLADFIRNVERHFDWMFPDRFMEFMELFDRYTEEFFEDYFLLIVFRKRVGSGYTRPMRVEHIDENGNILFAQTRRPPGPGPGSPSYHFMFVIELSNDHIPEEFTITTVWYWD